MILKLINFLYHLFWRPVGRPFTYIIRQWSKQNPWKKTLLVTVWVIGLSVLCLSAEAVYLRLLLYAVTISSGALWGHLFWDTSGEYIKHARDFINNSKHLNS